MKSISVSNNTVKRRIEDIAADIKSQICDDSTDIVNCAQLIVYARYIGRDIIQEEILYSQSLTAGNTSEDIFNSISNFVEKNDLEWKKLIVVCTDGAPVMIGTLPSLALRILVPFSSTYLCETGFSALVLIKTKRRNRLDVDSVLMIALAKVEPRINQQNMQSQVPTLILFKLFDKKHLFVHLNF
ncbi:unnamed protein product [Acanthoscelides obtectus]|uniref:Uncharacterized protein n=1 Tax=Acanthoscelides obtectus TaxID=200917 RepID=A0A9P0NTE3_ACAOB|nr:unnamed protein product [Acanthoscelides obtectus]